MKKKKVKDEDGYLGKHTHAHPHSHTDHVQLPRKKPCGSLSLKTSHNRKDSNLRLPNHRAARRESLLARKGREALPASSRRPEMLETPTAHMPLITV